MAISPLSNYTPISSQPDNIYPLGPEGREGLGKFAVPEGGVGLQLSRTTSPWPPRQRRAQIVKTLGMSIAD